MLERAYSVLTVKSIDAARRVFTGIATTPKIDRHGHSVNPLGLTYATRIPLLLHHDAERPIGWVTLQPATADGIAFEAEIPIVTEPGVVKDRTDEAWHSITARLLTALSVGLANAKRILDRASAVVQIAAAEICEVSLVTLPANTDATILTIKALDTPHLAATGRTRSGDSDPVSLRVAPIMKNTITEQITALENKRAATDARMLELMTKAHDAGTTLEDTDADEYENLGGQLKKVDRDLVFARELEKSQIANAARVTATQTAATITKATGTGPISVQIRPNVEPGTTFTRYVMAQLAAKGDTYRAIEYAKRWHDSTPEVEMLLKAAVAPGNTTDATWASPLVPTVRSVAAEFVALLMPATILGRIPGLTKVPFNTSVPIETDTGTYNWVGQGLAKPVTKLGFTSAKVDAAKIAGIITITEELARSSEPAAEGVIRNAMIAGITKFMDQQFIDPAVAAVAGTRPASITNGIAGTAATGDPFADLAALFAKFSAANVPLGGVALIMSTTNAMNLSMQLTVTGSPAFPSINATGGSIVGIPVIASETAGTNIVAVVPRYILVADDGSVTVDVSREASIQMDSAPANPADATTVMVSLWQNNLVGFRAERFVSWKRALDAAVQVITGASYPPIAP